MNFQITDGLNVLSIRLSEIGSYFYFKKPLTLVWNDCVGSIGQYLCMLSYSEEYRNEVRNKILTNLSTDYSDTTEQLKKLLQPLFKLFPNGEYSLQFYSGSSSYFEYTLSRDNYAVTHQSYWFLQFSKPMDVDNTELKRKEYDSYRQDRIAKGLFAGNIVEFSSPGFYEGNDIAFVATQPQSKINPERVSYFETQIRDGDRPFAIIFKCIFNQHNTNANNTTTDSSLLSANYILDGHHKLLAYHNLNINPPIVKITHYPQTRDEIEFNIEELMDGLYPWQIDHILTNWDEKEAYISKLLQNPESKIHDFIKKL